MLKRIVNNQNRIYAFVLVIVTLLTSLPFSALPIFSETASKSDPVVITLDGKEISELLLQEHDKRILHAQTDMSGENLYTWQIRDPMGEDRWIDIYGQVKSDIAITYALIGSMLTQNGEATIRCKLKNGSDEYFSKAVSIIVSYDVSDGTSEQPIGSFMGMGSVDLMNDGEEDGKTHSIVINYLFDNNAMAFEPYGASVAKGSDFTASVPSPKIVGYAPYRRIGEDYLPADTVELNYTNIQSDITINVIYEPALVSFFVHHHLQNLLDDEYSLHADKITEGKALTETLVPEGLALTEMELPGFRALAYERLTVAADGSTVVEIRYDRNYYLVDFEMAGGYGVDPVYTRYDMTVGANVPIRHGYVFGGWELVSYDGVEPTDVQKSLYDINNGRQINVPAANLRYRAIWITQETTYTMVFWRENADDDGYSYWGYLDGLSAMSGDYVSAADRVSEVTSITDEVYFTFNPERSDQNVLVEGDGSTVVNVYYTRNHYLLTFKGKGKCTIPANHTHGDDCYDEICGKGHVHDESCQPKLTCTTPVHSSHTDDCLLCTLQEHTEHTSACCGKTEHTHTISCWRNIGSLYTGLRNPPANPEDGQVYRSGRFYIFIKGNWYRYNGFGQSSGDIVDPSCGYDEEHTHGNSDCACTLPIHVHSGSCYKDTIHTHGEECYSYSCNQNEHIHSDKCYRLNCGITEGHVHSSTCNSSTATNTVKTVYRKYEQSLADLWPVVDDNGKTYDSGERWKPSSSSYYTQVLVYISTMPADDFTLTLDEANYDTFVMHYYLEVLPGSAFDKTYNGRNYKLFTIIRANYNYVTKAEDFFDIKGFVQAGSDPGFSNNQIDNVENVYFYYNRKVNLKLEFSNNGIMMDDKAVTGVLYEEPLKQHDFVPPYPSNLEPNAYGFKGWYTSPGCFDGTEVDWDSLIMPDGDLLLYAKWAPIQHTVKVYKDATLSEQIGQTQLVDHKAFAYAPESIPDNGNYVFQGWFYMDEENGVKVEKAFVFTGIPVLHDMDVYAKWSSHVSVNYTIHYVLKGTNTKIADDTKGQAIAGHNKTFDAKASTDLYVGYQTGYYPLANSHTITMSVDGTHEYTFEYVYVESMPYIVRYVDAITGKEVMTQKKVTDNNLSVVTETFVRVDKMMPDAYQKRLILSASGTDTDKDGVYDENVITFYYSSDDEHAYYRVVHYIQNISGADYREYRSVETVGLIGQSYSVDAMLLTGFEFAGKKTKVNGVVTQTDETTVTATLGSEGMLIELYYDRITVNYIVQYVEEGTDKQLIPDKKGSAHYGTQIAEYAVDLTARGYTLVGETLKTLVLSANETHNVIKFKYTQSTVSVKYQIVGPDGCGSLSQYSENVLAIDGELNGSVPTASTGYRFVGWYMDEACTAAINDVWVDSTNNKLVPVKASSTVWVEGTTFYAKFEANHTELIIHKTGVSATDELQASIFRVQGTVGTRTEGIDVIVSVIGNGTATLTQLPLGDYTVTELTKWSWRYQSDAAVKSIQLVADIAKNELVYHNNRVIAEWLDGNAAQNNVFDRS
ncbi:MAG: hypothetical protein E7599_07265 [Ruminococcaceae bacterium]|nr:hypothetical protein [Oscillospiraceae bacterium]